MHTAPTILVCDDEPAVRQMIAIKLRGAGYRVVEARHGGEALSLLGIGEEAVAAPPALSLVVTDLQMPFADGMEVCRRMHADTRYRGVPAIMLTARGYILGPEEQAGAGVSEIMCKPFSIRALLARVEAIVGRADRASRPAAA